MGLGFHRIPEKDQYIDFSFSDPGADLLVASQWSAHEFGDWNTQRLFQQLSCSAGGIKPVHGKNRLVVDCPFDKFSLFVVVCDQGDAFVSIHLIDTAHT